MRAMRKNSSSNVKSTLNYQKLATIHMNNVIHIGAAEGEIDYYEEIGCKNLTYVEPDKGCLIQLKENASKHFEREPKNLKNIKIIQRACSSESGRRLNFFSNSHGQSSIEKPGQKTKEIIGKEKAIACEVIISISKYD